MSLRIKLLLPVLLLLASISTLIHYYWVPSYLELETRNQFDNEQSFLNLLGTTLLPELLENDLAKTHATLTDILQQRKYWHSISLLNNKGQRLYPLNIKPLPQNIPLKLFQHQIIFEDAVIAKLNVWIDVETSTNKILDHMYHLEKLLLLAVLVIAIIVLTFQDIWITRPARKLSQLANEIANGNYNFDMEHKTSDEMGELVDSLNAMKKHIHQRELKIIESETRFKAVIDNAVDGIISIDTRGNILSFNPAARNIFGYLPGEVIGENVKMLMPQPYRDKHDGYLKNYQKTGIKKIIGKGRQVEGARKDGTTFPLDLAVNEIKLSDKIIYIGITRDISDRVRAANETQRHLTALEQLHDITSRPDQSFSEKIDKLLELGKKTFKLPLAIVSHIHGEQYLVEHISGPDNAPSPGTEFKLGDTYCCHTLSSKGPKSFEHAGNSYINSHPCYINFGLESYIGTPLYVGGEIYGTLNFSGPDVHEDPFTSGDYSLIQLFAQWIGTEIQRVKAETDLFNVLALRQAILDSANYSIISTDVDGTIRIFNTGAERMLGYSADEMIAKQTPAIIHDPDEISDRARELSDELDMHIEPGFDAFIAKTRMGNIDERQWTYIRKDGSTFPVLLSITAIHNSSGAIIGYLCIGSDLTERNKVDRMKNEFVSTVSHELRTPLTSIRGALGLVLGKFSDELTPNVLRMLETANRNSERLTHLINDILDLEKINAGKLDFDIGTYDLTILTARAIEENEVYAHSHKVSLQYTANADIKTIIRADEHRLLQVFANLISNAVKYSPENATVQIITRRNNGLLRTSIIDNGPGIPHKFRTKIFARFAQADSSDTRKKGGTGLGLTISRAIVEQLGGRIGFNTDTNIGTEFYFDLPSWDEAVESPASCISDVLVCEDDPDVAYILVKLLAEEGLTGDIAATANSARDLIYKNNYRLMLLDLNLPDSEGLQFLRELKNDKATRNLPIIVVSGTANEGKSDFNGDAVTVIDWLQKPVDRERLLRAVHKTIKKGSRQKILHVEDDIDLIQISQSLFSDEYDFDYATSIADAATKLNKNEYGLVILDLALPDGNGSDLLAFIHKNCPVVLFSGASSINELSDKVTATLSKATTSNAELIQTVKSLLSRRAN